jgi:hypothetical protein
LIAELQEGSSNSLEPSLLKGSGGGRPHAHHVPICEPFLSAGTRFSVVVLSTLYRKVTRRLGLFGKGADLHEYSTYNLDLNASNWPADRNTYAQQSTLPPNRTLVASVVVFDCS